MSDLNDPRVLFAAERTALAWNRTAITLMAFGFAIERFGLFMRMLVEKTEQVSHRGASFWGGAAFILLGGFFSAAAAKQYYGFLKTLRSAEIPPGYNTHLAFMICAIVALVSAVLTGYLMFSIL